MDLLQIVVLAIVQGLTEFLPVSSSAHLILVPVLTQWEDQGLAFDVALHIGSLGAVVLYFRQDISRMTVSWLRSLRGHSDAQSRLAWFVIFGTIPVGLAGLAFDDVVSTQLRSPLYIAAGLIVFGLLLGWADWRQRGMRDENQLNWKDVLLIGCAQALALFPGTSRSGITMTAGLMLGLSREAAARFSFLLSIPVTLIACALKTGQMIDGRVPFDSFALIVGILVSGISAYLCIHYFLAFIKRVGMMPFVIYRLVLGALLIWLFI